MRWMRQVPRLVDAADALLRADLAFIMQRARLPCFDIWEEEVGLHYYTLRVSEAALRQGADWMEEHGDFRAAHASRSEADHLSGLLESHWRGSHYGSRQLLSANPSAKDRDIAVLLAAIHVGGEGQHSPRDPRLAATLEQLEALFGAAYAINRNRPRGWAPAMGRYADDVYYSGGAYYFATLARRSSAIARGCGRKVMRSWKLFVFSRRTAVIFPSNSTRIPARRHQRSSLAGAMPRSSPARPRAGQRLELRRVVAAGMRTGALPAR